MELKKVRRAVAKPAALLGGALVAGAMLLPATGAQAQFYLNNDERIAAGYAANPVPLNLTGGNPAQVGIGSYIVNTAGVCNHCHSVNHPSPPDVTAIKTGNPYYLAGPNGPYTGRVVNGKATFVIDPSTFAAGGGASFGPLFVSKNLTSCAGRQRHEPDLKDALGGWRAAWTGRRFGGCCITERISITFFRNVTAPMGRTALGRLRTPHCSRSCPGRRFAT